MTHCPSCSAELTPLRKGGWFCEDCDRRYDGALRLMTRRASMLPPAPAPAARATRAPPAGPSAAEAPEVAGTSASLPFILAHPLERSRRLEITPTERAESLLWAAYQIVRLSGLLLLSDYLASPDECRKVNLAIRALRAPDWWGWTVLCNQLVRFWSNELDEKPTRGPRLPRVASGWRSFNRKNAASKKESKWGTLLEGLTGRDGPAHSGNDALWHAFERQGRPGPGERDTEAEVLMLDRIERLVEASAHRMFPKDSLQIVRRVGEPHDPKGVFVLHGPQADGRFRLQPTPSSLGRVLGSVESAVLVGDEVVQLFPMLLLFESDRAKGPYPGGGFTEAVSIEEGRGVVLGGRSSGTLRLVGPALDAFREKKVDMLARENEVSVAAIAPWAGVMLGGVLRQLRDRSYLPETYVERVGVDDALEAALQTPGRAVLVVGPVGSGKTSLLTRLSTRAARLGQTIAGMEPLDEVSEPVTSARRGGDIVLLLSGRGAYSMAMERGGAEMLADAVARKAGIKEKRFKSLADLCAALDEGGLRGEGRRVWLLLDGIDEAEHAPALIAALDQFLPAVARYPWLRLCVSVDDGVFHAPEAGLFTNERVFAQFQRPGAGAAGPERVLLSYLACRPFSPAELGQAYGLRLERAARGRPPMPPLEGLGKDTTALLSLPLHLHLFQAAYPRLLQRLDRLDEEALFAAYFETLSEGRPPLPEQLQQFGDAVLMHRSIDLLAAAVDRSRKPVTGGKGLPAPSFADLVDVGLLLPPCDDGGDGEEAYTPSSAAFARELLLGSLRRKLGGGVQWPDAEGLLGWTRELVGRSRKLDLSSPFVAMFLATLEATVQRMVRAGHGAQVAALMSVEDEGLGLRLLTAALLAIGRRGGKAEAAQDEATAGALLASASTPEGADRLMAATAAASRRLSAWGHAAAAVAVERLHLRAIRSRIAAGGDSVELQEAMGRSMVELATLLAQVGQHDNARRYALDAVRVLRTLGTAASSQQGLGAALRLSGVLAPARTAEGPRYLAEALEVLRNAEALEPPNAALQAEVAAVIEELARLASRSGDRAEAYARLSALAQARRRLVAADPQRLDWQQELGRTLWALAEQELGSGGHADARRYLEEAVAMLRAVVAREPRWLEAQRDLWRALGALGNLLRLSGARSDGLRLLEESLEGLRWLQSQDPSREDVRLDLAVALSRTGALLVMEGKRSRARRLLDEAVAILRDHARLSGELSVAFELASSLTNLGNLSRVEGKQSEARQHFHDATRLWESVAADDPRTEPLSQLAQSLWSSSLVETDPQERRRFLERLSVVFDELRARGPVSPSLLRLMDMASRALSAL